MLPSAPGQGWSVKVSKLNYITQLNMFEQLCIGRLPAKAQFIYYKLFKWSNRFGLGEPFQLSNKLIMSECEIFNEKTFIQNRNLLIQAGFINFLAGKKGSPSTYVICDLTKYTGNLQVNTKKNTGDTPVNNGKCTDDLQVNNDKFTGNTSVNNTGNTVIYTGDLQVNTTVNNDSLLIPNNIKTKLKDNRGDPSNLQSSSLNEATDIFQNTFRPLKNLDEVEHIKAMVEEYGIDRFKEAVKIAVHNRAKVPLPYLESVLRNNKASPQHNDPVAGAASAQRIIESGEILDFNSE